MHHKQLPPPHRCFVCSYSIDQAAWHKCIPHSSNSQLEPMLRLLTAHKKQHVRCSNHHNKGEM
eukprot:1152363-Pelagomonas_calceolata.AAC.1